LKADQTPFKAEKWLSLNLRARVSKMTSKICRGDPSIGFLFKITWFVEEGS